MGLFEELWSVAIAEITVTFFKTLVARFVQSVIGRSLADYVFPVELSPI
jgi:hypothetical protein